MKVFVTAHVGYVGMDSYEFWEYPDGTDSAIIDQDACTFAYENADSYGYYPYPDDFDPDTDDDEHYTDAIDGHWELYDSDKHDGYSFTGTPTFHTMLYA